MKNEERKIRNKEKRKKTVNPFFTFLFSFLILLSCNNFPDQPKSYTPDSTAVESGYGRISICVVGGETAARTALPSTAFDTYVYTFTKTRAVIIDMYDSFGDGWNSYGALRINVNGEDIAATVKVHTNAALNTPGGQMFTNTFTFDAVAGDTVQVYWVGGTDQSENSFIVYYADTPPVPAFTESNQGPAAWSGSNALIYRLRNTMDSISGGTLLGSFTGEADGVEKTPDNDGFFTLQTGDYEAEVQAFVGTTEPYTLAARGVSGIFSVGPGDNDPVEVLLSAAAAAEAGEFSYTVSYPAGSAAEITLQKWPELTNIALSPVKIQGGVTETLVMGTGSYLLTVLVSNDEKYAGASEAIHITPALVTLYTKVFDDSDLKLPYTVTFNSNGGSVVPAQNIKSGKTAARPENPAQVYYSFDNWYSDSGLNQVYNFSTLVSKNITLFAKWNERPWDVSTIAGGGGGYTDGQGAVARFLSPRGVAVDSAGNIFVADSSNHRIRKIDSSGIVSTIAGSTQGYVDGQDAAARFYQPYGVAVDGAGNIFVADSNNSCIRKIDSSGMVSTIAGDGTQGYVDGQGTSARFYIPYGVAVDSAGNIYVADTRNNRVRKIDSSGMVSTIAGGGGSGNADGQGAAARFYYPYGVAVDSAGNIFVADSLNHRIRKIDSLGMVSTVAGSTQGYADGQGTSARFFNPYGVAVDSAGNIFVADSNNYRIRKIDSSGMVSTIAGGDSGYADGQGTSARFSNPYGVAVDSAGNIYVADTTNNRIRKMSWE